MPVRTTLIAAEDDMDMVQKASTRAEDASQQESILDQYHNISPSDWYTVQDCVHELISKRAVIQPESQAIYSRNGEQRTYEELNRQSSDLAFHLQTLGVRQGTLVGFCFEKSAWAIISMLAILKAGCACVALDPSHPEQRMGDVLQAAKIRDVLTSSSNAHLFQARGIQVIEVPWAMESIPISSPLREGNSIVSDEPDSPAFVVFTSGSSGVPKGVILEHSAVCTSAHHHGAAMGVNSKSRVLQYAPYTFDMSIYDIFTTLIWGGCVCVIAESDRMDDISGSIRDTNANWAFFTPSTLSVLEVNDVKSLRTVLLAGEPVGQDIVDKWAGNLRLINGYGSTECSTCVIGDLTPCSQPNSIGKPAGVNYWITDPDDPNVLQPPGVPGELLVQGPVLARGYLEDAMENAAKFIDPPSWLVHNSLTSHLYRTGDLVRADPDGNLSFVGRIGNMVKIRGRRVELEEVEKCLMGHSAVELALVSLPKDGLYANSLVAVVTVKGLKQSESDSGDNIREINLEQMPGCFVDSKHLRQYVTSVLPSYMVPDVCIFLEKMPFTSSGKIDRTRVKDWLTSCHTKPSLQDTVRDVAKAPVSSIQLLLLEMLGSLTSNGHSNELLKALQDEPLPLFLAGYSSMHLMALANGISKSFNMRLTATYLGSSTLHQIVRTIERHQAGSFTNTQSYMLDALAEYHSLLSELDASSVNKFNGSCRVFLTGCTGFLGIHLLSCILSRSPYTIVTVLIRASNLEAAMQRLKNSAAQLDFDIYAYLPRIEIWTGDLSHPHLGLTSQQWGRLESNGRAESSFDAVIHNGAVVNWIMDYQSLKAQNVLSTLRLLQACRLSRHHQTFIYVSGGQRWKEIEYEAVKALMDANQMGGYDLSKLISEQLVKAFARESGRHAAAIVRPGYIIGGLDRAEANTDDFLWRVVAASIDVRRSIAESDDAWLYVCGADEVANKVTENLEHDTASRTGCAIRNVTDGLRVCEFWDIIKDCGFELIPVTSVEWLELVGKRIDAMADVHPLWPFRDFLETNSAFMGVPRVETHESCPRSTLRLRRTIQKNVEYLKRIGYLGDPTKRAPAKAAGVGEPLVSRKYGVEFGSIKMPSHRKFVSWDTGCHYSKRSMTAIEPSRRSAHDPTKSKKRKRAEESQSQKKRKSLKPAGVNALPWKEVPLPDNLDDAEGFFGLEEISDVELVRDEKLGRVEYRHLKPTDTQSRNGHTPEEAEWSGCDDSDSHEDAAPHPKPKPQAALLKSSLKKTSEKTSRKSIQELSEVNGFENLRDGSDQEDDVSAWHSLGLSPQVLSSLAKLHFEEPTPIQNSAIPEILRGQNVIGKASTGSGKTLAFGIPILEHYLEHCNRTSDKRRKSIEERESPPTALILSPTRELAHQLSKHLNALCSNVTSDAPHIATITGGLAPQKQQRNLANADIIIGTPGRLWEIISSTNGLMPWLRQINYLVLDEADRLLSEGHFKELEEILDTLNKTDTDDHQTLGNPFPSRQTLIFSATFSPTLNQKLSGQLRPSATSSNSLEPLLSRMNFSTTPKFIDASPKSHLPTSLNSYLLSCDALEKDLYLYALLLTHFPTARTLVFANSIHAPNAAKSTNEIR
ncbi:MAG: hypothetical protein Q9172_005793 [Xanthocarpia lactea]